MSADLIARTGYQVGKSPLMPLFAASLGAGELLVGAIVSASTITGIVLKPIFGWLSDRSGRTIWLFIGLAFFSGVPFLYSFVDSATGLLVIRLFHGLATAIFGPVTLALVAEMTPITRAERLGWFGMARSGSYLLAPLIGSWLLTRLDPSTIFTLIGLISCAAFLPVCMMDSTNLVTKYKSVKLQSIRRIWKVWIGTVVFNRGIWLAGSMELVVYFMTYSIKVFLPLYALQVAGFNLIIVGLFFTVQELLHLVTRPMGGRLGDHIGYLRSVQIGYGILIVGLISLPYADSETALLLVASLLGLGQGLIFPSTVAFVADRVNPNYLGVGMGLLGAVRNAGKVVGPLTAGALLTTMNYSQVFHLGAVVVLIAAFVLFLFHKNGMAESFVSTKM
tara:strand:- start:1454 stop:2626 length:1173 start_codon:yes stop_codon:yes gene_type:complete